MTIFEACMIVEDGDDDEDTQIEAWQLLHTSGAAYSLQGWYGRTAQELLSQGVIS